MTDQASAQDVKRLNIDTILETIERWALIIARENDEEGAEPTEVDLSTLPSTVTVDWQPFGVPQKVTLNLNAPWPWNKTMRILAIFHDETVIRVYGVPTGPDAKGNAQPFCRYTMQKESPTVCVDAMGLDVFQAEIADELLSLRESTREVPDEEPEDEGETPEGIPS